MHSTQKIGIPAFIDKHTLLSKINVLDFVKSCCSDYTIEGKDIVILNPHRADNNLGSLRVCIEGEKTGFFHDFADHAFKGRNIIDFTMKYYHFDFKEATQYLYEYVNGLSISQTVVDRMPTHRIALFDDTKNIITQFKGSLEKLNNPLNLKGKEPTATYIYTNAENHPMIQMHRYELEDRKHFLAQSYTTENKWEAILPTNNRPLYNLHQIVTEKHNRHVLLASR